MKDSMGRKFKLSKHPDGCVGLLVYDDENISWNICKIDSDGCLMKATHIPDHVDLELKINGSIKTSRETY